MSNSYLRPTSLAHRAPVVVCIGLTRMPQESLASNPDTVTSPWPAAGQRQNNHPQQHHDITALPLSTLQATVNGERSSEAAVEQVVRWTARNLPLSLCL